MKWWMCKLLQQPKLSWPISQNLAVQNLRSANKDLQQHQANNDTSRAMREPQA